MDDPVPPPSPTPSTSARSTSSDGAPRRRPLVERIGLALIAIVMAVLFAVVAVASFVGGEPFLGVMGAIGCLMVLWVGGLSLIRG